MMSVLAGKTAAAGVEDEQTLLYDKSYEEYLAASKANPTLRVEYIDGVIIMSPSSVPDHQRALRNVFVLIYQYAVREQLGEVFFAPIDVELLPRARMLVPDMIFIAHDKRESLIGPKRVEGAPDLAVEVLSPSTARTDRTVKLPVYAEAGVGECWIVDPEQQTVEAFILDGESYRVAGAYSAGQVIDCGQFVEAQIAVDDIFAF